MLVLPGSKYFSLRPDLEVLSRTVRVKFRGSGLGKDISLTIFSEKTFSENDKFNCMSVGHSLH